MTEVAFHGMNSGVQVGTSNAPINNTQVYLALERLETQPSPLSTVPFRRDSDFVDRGALFDQIDEKTSETGSRIALVGLGGVGKSQLVIEFSYRTRDKSPETWVFWIHASNAARFEQSCREIADRVKIHDRQDPKANVFKLLRDWLQDEANGKWVLILDNLDNAQFLHGGPGEEQRGIHSDETSIPTQSIWDYFPQSLNGLVIITSRSRQAVSRIVEDSDIIPVDPMDEAHAIRLFEKKLGLDAEGDKGDIVKLSVALEFMPLAIVQAAAYIKRRAPRISVLRYLNKFQKNDNQKISLLDYEGGNLRRDREAKNSILVTWQISFDHIRQMKPSAADLLSLMSFFDRQGIPDHLLREGSDMSEDNELSEDSEMLENGEMSQYASGHSAQALELTTDSSDAESKGESSSMADVLEDDILVLRDYSLISIGGNADKTNFEMHRLVQLATQEWLKAHEQLESFKEQFIRKLYRNFPYVKFENWSRCQVLFAHVKCALTQRPHTETSLKEWASLLYMGALFALDQGNFVDGRVMAERAVNAREELFGPENEKTLWSSEILGRAYMDAGQWKDAESLQVQVMEIYKASLGEGHPYTQSMIRDLASTYTKQGRWREAETLLVRVVEISKAKLGKDHLDTLLSMESLASTYRKQYQLVKAEELLVQVVETRKTKCGKDHLHTLASIHDLASTYTKLGQWEEAETLLIELVETRKIKIGKHHRDTLASMHILALTYKAQGRLEEAEILFLQVIEISKTKLGEDHPDTLASINSLASTYRKQGRWEKAKELLVQVVETRRSKFGKDHPSALSSMYNLALIFMKREQWEKAEELLVEVMETRRSKLGNDHPRTLTSMHSLALVHMAQHQWEKSEELLIQLVETRTRTNLGEDHPDTLACMHNLALTYRKQGRLEEAEKLFALVDTLRTG